MTPSARPSATKSTEADGELRAIAWLQERTGISFTDDLWTVKFTLFTLTSERLSSR